MSVEQPGAEQSAADRVAELEGILRDLVIGCQRPMGTGDFRRAYDRARETLKMTKHGDRS